MKTKVYDQKDKCYYEADLSLLPYLPLAKEQLKTLTLFGDAVAGKVMLALVDEVYCSGKRHLLSKLTENEKEVFDMMTESIGRLSLGSVKKYQNLKNNKVELNKVEETF